MESVAKVDELLSTTLDPIITLAFIIGLFLGISLVVGMFEYYYQKNKNKKDNGI